MNGRGAIDWSICMFTTLPYHYVPCLSYAAVSPRSLHQSSCMFDFDS